ncbi:MAG: ABC transporter substrate-binding protein, partial [Chloroflexota bacterium]|nr:ABC transporter substrate-binding protein [Chloroflexota bacterium]
MPNHWFRNPRALVVAPILAIMALAAVACGAAATATPVPTAAPTEAPAAEAMPEPTAMPEAMDKPADEMMDKPDTMAMSDVVPIPDHVADFYGDVVYGGTLRVNYEDPLEHANAWGAGSGVTDRYRMPTGALLVMENPYDSGAPIIPDLAESWELSEGLDGITFNFREGVTWHNGDAFTCEDARFSFDTMKTGNGITASYMQSRLANVQEGAAGFSCLDDNTFQINFTGPSGESVLLLPLSNRRAQIFNKAWFEAGGEEAMFQDVSVGLGPFMWRADQQVGIDTQYFDKNPNYYFPGLPYVDELVINGILDESTQQATQLAHQTDWH